MTLLVATCQSFSQISVGRASITTGGLCPSSMVSSSSSARCIPQTVLFSSTDEPEKEPSKTQSTPEPVTPPAPAPSTSVLPVAVNMDMEEDSSIPLDVPSPLLLASSIIIAIISVGSLFDLLGGSPSLGFAPSAGIALVGLPVCFFLFYAAIVKGQKETEDDDEKFKNSGGF